ncbi:PKD domain-containing protein [Chitinophagales bacterium]|nr:PKD domain-containing protein [Chitinophagales bacterium]
MRLRVYSQYSLYGVSCESEINRQVVDYALAIEDNVFPPIADFEIDPVIGFVGQSILFKDVSQNLPTNWSWSFPGSDEGASDLQNPLIHYSDLGQYNAELTVSNDFGSDVFFVPNAISILNQFNFCDFSYTESPTGVFYDSGGELGNYGEYENCSLLIDPECATSITLEFDQFETSTTYDYMKVYDGPDEEYPLLGTFDNDDQPGTIISSGGELFLKWRTNGSFESSGFSASWQSTIGSSQQVQAAASVNNSNPALGEAVQFFDLSLEDPVGWFWDFGDGTTSTMQHPEHYFLSTGPKTIILQVINCTSTDSDTITVNVQEASGAQFNPSALYFELLDCAETDDLSISLLNNGPSNLDFELVYPMFTDDFDDGVETENLWSDFPWSFNVCGQDEVEDIACMRGNGTRDIATEALALPPNSRLSFDFKFCENSFCNSEWGYEHRVVVEYSFDDNEYIQLVELKDFEFYSSFQQVVVNIPNETFFVPTHFQIRQIDHESQACQNWCIDNFQVLGMTNPHVQVDPSQGTVLPGQTEQIDLTLNRSFRSVGNHTGILFFELTNETEQLLAVPTNLLITGEANLVHSSSGADCWSFPTINELSEHADSLWISNFGCDDLYLSDFLFSAEEFEISELSDAVLRSGDTLWFYGLFNPEIFGEHEATLDFLSNGVATSICLNGTADPVPDVSSSVEEFNLSGTDCPSELTTSFYLYNDGNTELEFEIIAEPQTYLEDFNGGYSELPEDFIVESTGYNVTSNYCGAADEGKSHKFFVDDGRYIITVPLHVGSDSRLSFYLKYGSYGDCIIAPQTDAVELQYSVKGGTWQTIETYSSPTSYSIWTFIDAAIPEGAYSPSTQFRIIQPIQLAGEPDRFQIDILNFERGQPDEYTITPSSGTVAVNDSILINVDFLAEYHDAGFYQDTLNVLSNDPYNSLIEIAHQIEITGGAQLVLSEEPCFIFDSIPEFTSQIAGPWIVNEGCVPLALSDFLVLGSSFNLSLNDTLLNSHDTLWIPVVHNPIDLETDLGTVFFESEGETHEICLNAPSVGSPMIDFNVDVLNMIGENCASEITDSFYIVNSGNEELNWYLQYSFVEDFEDENEYNSLLDFGSGVTGNICGVFEGNAALRFAAEGERSITTNPFSVNESLEFSFHLKYGDSEFCDVPEAGEFIHLQYSLDGINWVTYRILSLLQLYTDFNLVNIAIPEAAYSPSTRLRITQLNHSGLEEDVWMIDNVTVIDQSLQLASIFPRSGSLAIGDSTKIVLTILTDEFVNVDLNESLTVFSDDPVNGVVNYTLSVETLGDPELTINGATCLDLGANFFGAPLLDSIYVENMGCAPMTITGIESPDDNISPVAALTNIPGGEGDWLYFEYNLLDVESFEWTMTILSNSNAVDVCLTGESLPAPVFSTDELGVQLDLSTCNASIDTIVTIYNEGLNPLDYSVETIGSGGAELEDILAAWEAGHENVTNLIPDAHHIDQGIEGTNIHGQPFGISNVGNRIYIEMGDEERLISYSQNTIGNLYMFDYGQVGRYFTSKVNNMFFLAVHLDSLNRFRVEDGYYAFGKTKDEVELEYTINGVSYTGFGDRAYGTSGPSINHLFITETNDDLWESRWYNASGQERTVSGLVKNKWLFYLLFSSEDDNFVDDASMQAIMEGFLKEVHPDYLETTISNNVGQIAPGDSAQVQLSFDNSGAEGGLYTSYLEVESNDPLNENSTIPININVSETPCIDAYYEFQGGCEGIVRFYNTSTNWDQGSWGWDFGDGTTSLEISPVHSYSEEGTYVAVLTGFFNGNVAQYEMLIEANPVDVQINHNIVSEEDRTVFFQAIANTSIFKWYYGNGESTYEFIPSHLYTYPSNGVYTVTLEVNESNCVGTASVVVALNGVGLESLDVAQVRCYPNPVNDLFIIDVPFSGVPLRAKLFDAASREVMDFGNLNSGINELMLNDLPAGIYSVQLYSSDYNWNKSLIKE